MNKITVIALIGILILISCGPSPLDALQHNDKIVLMQKRVATSVNQIYKSFKKFEPTTMDSTYNEALKCIKIHTDSLNRIHQFDNKDIFRKAAIELLKTYDTVVKSEYSEMITIYKLPDDLYTAIEVKRLETLSKESHNKLVEAETKFSEVQKQFAEKYHIKLKYNN